MNKTYKNYLEHHGILGQKWGVRRTEEQLLKNNSENNIVSKKGEIVDIHKNPTSATAKFLSKIIPSIKENISNYSDYDIYSKEGKKVGNLSTNKDSKDSLNIVWIGINDKSAGKGYAQSAMRTVIEDSKKNGFKNVTLEVPTNSPNARHIYEKLGFKTTGEFLGNESDVWGGLTKMKLDL